MPYVALRLIVTGGLLALGPGPVLAQQSRTVEPGARLRLTLAPGQALLVGTYVRRVGDSLEMRFRAAHGAATQIVAIERITRIEVAQGRRHHLGKSALVGGAMGGAAGALFGLLVPDTPIDAGGFYYWTRGGTVALWSSIGAGSGLLAGVAVSLLGPERWAPGTIAGARPIVTAAATSIRLGWRIPLRR
jgi:hypothetical protein